MSVLLFVLHVVLIVKLVLYCSTKKSDKAERRNKRRHHERQERRHQEVVQEPPLREQPPLPEVLPVPGITAPQPEPAAIVGTAREPEEPAEDFFKCRDYTPAIFGEVQNLFELLKQS